MHPLLSALLALLRAVVMPRAKPLENAALRQQLAVYLRSEKRPRLRPGDRVYWVVLRSLWSDWHRSLVFVQPATVIGWHRTGFTTLWRGQRPFEHVVHVLDPRRGQAK